MGSSLSAHVVFESGDDFTAKIANLTTHSLFVRTLRHARFREKVTVTFFSVSVDGEVVHASSEPPGLVVAFDAPAHTRRLIEERMHVVDALWPDLHRHFDRQPTIENLIPPAITDRHSDFEEPTNTGSPPIQVPDELETADVLSSPAGIPILRDGPRLRATTVVGEHKTDEVMFDEPTED